MTNIINLSKEKSTWSRRNGEYQFKTVFLKANHETNDDYFRTWEIERELSGRYHIITSKTIYKPYNDVDREYTKVYDDDASFEKALKRLQRKIDKLEEAGLLLKVYAR